jgi:hypothetical protein
MSTRPDGAQTLANAYPHPMCVGHDDKLYIGNGRYLFMYDYADTAHTDGKLFRNVLILPKNFVIKSIQKLQPRTLSIFRLYKICNRGFLVFKFNRHRI